MNRYIINIKYNVKTMIERLDKLDESIQEMNNYKKTSNNLMAHPFDSPDNFLDILDNKLPLKTNDALIEFENKLMENIFRSNLVNFLLYIFLIFCILFIFISIGYSVKSLCS